MEKYEVVLNELEKDRHMRVNDNAKLVAYCLLLVAEQVHLLREEVKRGNLD